MLNAKPHQFVATVKFHLAYVQWAGRRTGGNVHCTLHIVWRVLQRARDEFHEQLYSNVITITTAIISVCSGVREREKKEPR